MEKIIQNSISDSKIITKQNPKINIRIDPHISSEINVYIESLKRIGNFKYPSLSDFIRYALKAYCSGMKIDLIEHKIGEKKIFSLTVSQQIKDLFDNLPKKNKTRIVESCVLTFYKNDVA